MKGKTKITPILHSRETPDGKFYVKIRITQNRQSKFINLGFRVRKTEWNNTSKRVRSNCKDYQEYNRIIEEELDTINLRHNPRTNIQSIQLIETPVFDILRQRYDSEKQNPYSYSIRKKLNTSIRHLVDSGLSKTPLSEFDKDIVKQFDNFLKNKVSLKLSSIFSYHRMIRSSLNKFCDDNNISKSQWEDPYTKKIIDKTTTSKIKFSLTGKEIHTLDEYLTFQPNKNSREFQSVCMFLFSYYSLGMRFGDVFLIRWDNFKDGFLDMISEKTKHHHVPMKLNNKQTNLIKYFTPLSDFYTNGSISFEKLKDIRTWFPDVEELMKLETEYITFRKKILNNIDSSFYSVSLVSISFLVPEKKKDDVSEQLHQIIQRRDELLYSFILQCCSRLKTPIFPFNSDSLGMKEKQKMKKESSNALVNKELRKVSQKLKFRTFSFHHSRHSFSHNARLSKKFDLYLISRCLGHQSLDVTSRYLRSIDSSEIDDSTQKFIEQDMNSYYNDTVIKLEM